MLALENLQGVTTASVESYMDRGDALPSVVQAALEDQAELQGVTEVLIAV